MSLIPSMGFTLLLANVLFVAAFGFDQGPGCHSTCREKAYTGPYEIVFPRDCRSEPPSRSCWLIKAYRKGYVVQLSFSDVNVTDSEQITVHDGMDTYGSVLASFCSQTNPQILTSNRHAFIVFSSNRTGSHSSRFKVKYRAVKRRSGRADPYALSFAFGGSIGAIALIVVCSGAFRRYKLAQRGQGTFFWVGRPRGNGAGRARGDNNGQTANPNGGEVERLPFRKRMLKFIQEVLGLKTLNSTGETSTPTSDNSSESTQQRYRSRDRQVGRSTCPHRSCSTSSTNNRYPDLSFSSTSHDATDSSTFNAGHEAFGYQDIPVSSFTSDPDAVRPPTYEDSVSRMNPLYVCKYGTAVHCNPAFDMKEEDMYMFSPPPPYTETNQLEQEVPTQSGSRSYAREVVTLDPVEILQPASVVDRDGSVNDDQIIRPTEDHKSADQEITRCNKDISDGNDRDTIEVTRKEEACHRSHLDDLGSDAKIEENIASSDLQNDDKSDSESPSHRFAENEELNMETILVDATNTTCPGRSPRCQSQGNDRNRHTVTIPFDMMRRSGLKTTKLATLSDQSGVPPVEECGAFAQNAILREEVDRLPSHVLGDEDDKSTSDHRPIFTQTRHGFNNDTTDTPGDEDI